MNQRVPPETAGGSRPRSARPVTARALPPARAASMAAPEMSPNTGERKPPSQMEPLLARDGRPLPREPSAAAPTHPRHPADPTHPSSAGVDAATRHHRGPASRA